MRQAPASPLSARLEILPASTSPKSAKSLGQSPKFRWRHGDLPALVGLGGTGSIGDASTCWSSRAPSPNAWARERVMRTATAPSSQDRDLRNPPSGGRMGMLRGGFKSSMDEDSEFADSMGAAPGADQTALFAEASTSYSSRNPGVRSAPATQELRSLGTGWASFHAPFGGMPRTLRPLTDVPAKMAAPVVKPHNAWFLVIQWQPPIDGEADPNFGYELNCRKGDAGKCSEIKGLSQEPWVQLAGLANGKTHYFQVRGTNANGAGEWSNWSCGYNVPEVPEVDVSAYPKADGEGQSGQWSPPRLPASASDSTSSAVLQWEEPCSHGAQIIGYKLQYGLDPSNEATIKTLELMSRKTSVEVGELLPNRVYYFRVQARNEVDCSAWTSWSEGIATRAVAPEEPTAPSLLEATAYELTVQWKPPKSCGFGAESYELRVGTDDSMTHANMIQGPSNGCVLRIANLHPNTHYYVQVRAISSMGPSPWSQTSKGFLTGRAVPYRCAAPKAIMCSVEPAEGRITSAVQLEWTIPASHGLQIQRYLLRWAAEPYMREELGRIELQGPDVKVVESKGVFEVKGLLPGSCYHFVISAANSAGYGKPSAVSDAVLTSVAAPERPDPPSIVERTARTFLVEVSDTVRDNGSKVLQYELKFDKSPDMRNATFCSEPMRLLKDDPDAEISTVQEVAMAKAMKKPGDPGAIKKRPRRYQLPVTNLKDRAAYYLSVRAMNSEGYSVWSHACDPQFLTTNTIGSLAAPQLMKAFHNHMLISYQQSPDARPKPDDSIVSYELRYARKEQDFGSSEDDQSSFVLCKTRLWTEADGPEDFSRLAKGCVTAVATVSSKDAELSQVKSLRWDPPPLIRGEPPPPLRVDHLLSGRSYFYQVRALSGDGSCSQWSEASASLKTLSSPPEKPEPITRGADEFTSHITFTMTLPEPNGEPIRWVYLRIWGPEWKTSARPKPTEWEERVLAWDSCDKIEKRKRNATPQEIANASAPGFEYAEVWHYTVGCLDPGAAFKFKYACENSVGLSEWSDDSDFVYTTSERPHQCEAPYLAQPEETYLGADHMTLEWKPAHDGGKDILYYTLRWALNATMEKATLVENLHELRCTLNDLQAYQFYYFQVCATTELGTSPWSKIDKRASVGCQKTKPTIPGPVWRFPPEAPVALFLRTPEGATKTTADLIVASWGKPQQDGGRQVTRYRVFISEDPEMEYCEEVLQKASRERVLTGLRPETLYYVDVCAGNSEGYGPRTFTPAQISTPALPDAISLPPKKPRAALFNIKEFTPDQLQKPIKLDEGTVPRKKSIEGTSAAEATPKAESGTETNHQSPSKGGRRGSVAVTLSSFGFPSEPEKWTMDITKTDKIKILAFWMCPEEYHRIRGFIYDEDSQTHKILRYNVKVLQYREVPLDYSTCGTVVDVANFEPDAQGAEEVHTFEVEQRRDRRDVPQDEYNAVRLEILPGRWYYASVQSINEVGVSAWSHWSEVCRGPSAQPEPVDCNSIEAVDRTPGSLLVQWVCPYGNGDSVGKFNIRWRKDTADGFDDECNAEEDIRDVEIDDDEDSFGDDSRLFRVDKAGTRCEFEITGLRHATHYVVEVKPINEYGPAAWASSAPLRTASGLPSAPGPALGVEGSLTPANVTVSWEPPEDDGGEPIESYELIWVALPCGAAAGFRDLNALFGDELLARDEADIEALRQETLQLFTGAAFCGQLQQALQKQTEEPDDQRQAPIEEEADEDAEDDDTDLANISGSGQSASSRVIRVEVGPTERKADGTGKEGLRPGDAMVSAVRALTSIGYGPWGRLPCGTAEIKALSTLPTAPSPSREAPKLTQSAGVGVRPFSLDATWRVPELNGLPIQRFTLLLRPADDLMVAHADSLPAWEKKTGGAGMRSQTEKPKAVPEDGFDDTLEAPNVSAVVVQLVLEHPKGQKPWEEGDEISMSEVHAKLTAGVSYVAMVRATNKLGEPVDWGPASEPQASPPDLPEKPAPPVSPFQWPSGIEVAWQEPCMNGAPMEELDAKHSNYPSMKDAAMIAKEVLLISEPIFKLEDLEALSDYYVQVRVRNALGWSQWSNPSPRVRTTTTRPKAPKLPEVHMVTPKSFQFRWEEPPGHGTPISDYDILMAEGKHASTLQQVLDMANREVPEEAKRDIIINALPLKARVKKTAEEASAAQSDILQHFAEKQATTTCLMSHCSSGLFCAIDYSVSVRAKNEEGWSDWSKVLGPHPTLSAPPEQCKPVKHLEVGQTYMKVEYALPYDNGASITMCKLSCLLIHGPHDRRLRPGEEVPQERWQYFDVPITEPRPTRAPPGGFGGTCESLIENLQHGAEYEVAVTAENTKGPGLCSLGVRALCLPGAPDAPAGVKHVIHGQGSPGKAKSAGEEPRGTPKVLFVQQDEDEEAEEQGQPNAMGEVHDGPRAVVSQ